MPIVAQIALLTLLLLTALVIGTKEQQKKLLKELSDLVSRFSPSNPEEEQAKADAEKAIKKAQTSAKEEEEEKKPDPKPSGNTPPPTVYTDTGTRDREEDDKCKKINAQLGLKPHGSGGSSAANSHHVLQKSYFQTPNGKPVPTICASYSMSGALAMPVPPARHGMITAAQQAAARNHKQIFELSNNTIRPSYFDAKNEAEHQLRNILGLSEEQIDCVMKAVDANMHAMCPNIDSARLRIPWTSDPGP